MVEGEIRVVKLNTAQKIAKIMTSKQHPNRKILLEVGDGPEGITIYTDSDEGMVDWCGLDEPMYVLVSLWGANAKFGPFTLDTIRQGVVKALKEKEKI